MLTEEEIGALAEKHNIGIGIYGPARLVLKENDPTFLVFKEGPLTYFGEHLIAFAREVYMRGKNK